MKQVSFFFFFRNLTWLHKRVWLAAFKGSDEELLSRNIFYHPSSSLTPITAVNRSSQHLGAWQNLSDRSELRQQLCWVNYSLLNEQHLSHLSLSTEESLRDESKCKVSPCASASSHFYLLSSQMCWKKKGSTSSFVLSFWYANEERGSPSKPGGHRFDHSRHQRSRRPTGPKTKWCLENIDTSV